jgi:hypothetical protein
MWLNYVEMDYDQRLHAQKDKRNEEKTMSVDENVFFVRRPCGFAAVLIL